MFVGMTLLIGLRQEVQEEKEEEEEAGGVVICQSGAYCSTGEGVS